MIQRFSSGARHFLSDRKSAYTGGDGALKMFPVESGEDGVMISDKKRAELGHYLQMQDKE